MKKLIGLILITLSATAFAKHKMLYCGKSFKLNGHQHYDCTFENNSLIRKNTLSELGIKP